MLARSNSSALQQNLLGIYLILFRISRFALLPFDRRGPRFLVFYYVGGIKISTPDSFTTIYWAVFQNKAKKRMARTAAPKVIVLDGEQCCQRAIASHRNARDERQCARRARLAHKDHPPAWPRQQRGRAARSSWRCRPIDCRHQTTAVRAQ